MVTLTLSISIVVIFIVSWIANILFVNAAIRRIQIKIPDDMREKREFSAIRLSNGLKVLLISDKIAEKSMATMAVRVGAINDEKEQPGIANLVRYLLLSASKTYPKKYEFNKFLQKEDGKLDLRVVHHADSEYKQYFSFEVDNDSFGAALKRFATYFMEPVFQEVNDTALKEALGNYYKEHDHLMSTDDDLRINQLLKSLSEEGHPYRNLALGTVETLNKYAGLRKETIDEKLTAFHKKWYSANLMCLVVFGKGKLKFLERVVETAFRGIKNNGAEELKFSDDQHAWKLDQVKQEISIVPLKNSVRSIRLTFPTPDVTRHYKILPEKYVISLFEHRGPGSLGMVLHRKGLCKLKNLRAEYKKFAGMGFFTVLMKPTKYGAKKVNYILSLTFQYIRILQAEGVQEWFYDENNRMNKMYSKIYDQRPLTMVQSLASAMHDYPIQDILTFEFRGPWDRTPIDEFLSHLRPDNVNISVINTSFKPSADKTEPWYGTKYQIKPLSEDLLREWNSPSVPVPELKIPPRNDFIPRNIQVTPPTMDEPISEYPYIIRTSPMTQIWYKRSDQLPFIEISLNIICPIVRTSLINRSLTDVFIRMVRYSLLEIEYYTKITALGFDVSPTMLGLQVKVNGVAETCPMLLEKVLARLLNFESEMNKEDFERAKKEEITWLQQSIQTENANYYAYFYATALLNQIGTSVEPVISSVNGLKFERMKNFPKKLFSRIYVQGFVYGNCNEQKAKDIANIIERSYSKQTSSVVLPPEKVPLRTVRLDDGKNLIIHTTSGDILHYYYAYFPFNPTSIRQVSIGNLLVDVLSSTCVKIIPPQEIGTSECLIEYVNDVPGFVFKVSSNMNPYDIEKRVDMFLEIAHRILQKLTEQDFAQIKMKLVMQKIAQRFGDNSTFYWQQIQRQYYNFKKIAEESEFLENLQKEDLIAFFQEILSKHSPMRRKLAVYVFSSLAGLTQQEISGEKTNDKTRIIQIEDIQTGKNSLKLYAIPTPQVKLPK